MIAAPKNVVSIGRLAGMLDTTRDRLVRAAEQSGVKPVETIDAAPFFDADDVPRLRDQLASKEEGK